MIAPTPPRAGTRDGLSGARTRFYVVSMLCCAASDRPIDVSSGRSITRHTPAARASGQRTVLGMPPHTRAIVRASVWRKRDVREAGSQFAARHGQVATHFETMEPAFALWRTRAFQKMGVDAYATRTTAL